jgi:integrase
MPHLTNADIRRLVPPERGNRIVYDTGGRGFGIRITAAGARSFILNYSTRAGRTRRFTIGRFGDWSVGLAREEAHRLRRQIDAGGDPLADIEAEREAPTVADLIKRFQEEHVAVKLRPAVRDDYRRMIKAHVLPHLSEKTKVADVTPEDIERIHGAVTKTAPYRANRVVTLLSKMFSLSVKWKMRTDNPCKGAVERNPEINRRRYLSGDELARLTDALAKANRDTADVIRLLLLSGARRGEVLSMRWADLDLSTGIWTKPASATKTGIVHDVPLSAPARALLAERWEHKAPGATFVFPSTGERGYLVNLWRQWSRILADAKIKGLRIHDLRHSFASELVSSGASLPLIASLLGHRDVQTTQRYAHLHMDPRRAAVEKIGAVVANAGKPVTAPTRLKSVS